jgi:broad specificity phosphatase PhoE
VPATAKTRQRRRRRRAFTLLAYIIAVFALAWFFESQGTTTIIFVRHADTDLHGQAAPDTPLNRMGSARAERLADTLAFVDVVAGPNAIYASDYKHTQQTAEPLAKRLGVEIEVEDHYEVVDFMKKVLWDHKREVVLIVTHRDAIAPLIEELHGSKNIPPIAADDYDDLYVVTIPWFGKVKTQRWDGILQLESPAP